MSHLATIRAMPCMLCELLGMPQTSRTDAHHARTGQGGAQRAPDELAIPLCHETCHQGPRGVHGDRSLLRLAKVTELDLLALTIRRLVAAGVAVPEKARTTPRRARPSRPTVRARSSTATPAKILPRRLPCT